MKRSLQFYKKFIVYKDSLKSIEIVQKAADIRTNYEIAQNKLKWILNQQKQIKRQY
jgi:hypothetical protein